MHDLFFQSQCVLWQLLEQNTFLVRSLCDGPAVVGSFCIWHYCSVLCVKMSLFSLSLLVSRVLNSTCHYRYLL